MKKQIVVDVHTHVFNADYLPLEGIILEYFCRKTVEDYPTEQQIESARVLAAIIEGITLSNHFQDMEAARDWIDNVEKASDPEDFFKIFSDVVLREFLNRMRSQPAFKAHALRREDKFSAAIEWVVNEFPETKDSLPRRVLDHIEVMSALERWQMPLQRALWTASMIKFLRSILKSMKGSYEYLRFIGMQIVPVRAIIDRLMTSYSGKEKEADVRLFVHHMMDMQKAYSRFNMDPPVLNYNDEQVPIMSELTREHDCRLLGFVAFDPRRWRESEVNGFLDDAINNKGFWGVKFYPSMGYKPCENTDSQIEASVKALFQYCCDNQIPVLSHCQLGAFCANFGWDQYTNPELWRKALAQNEGRFNNLILCLGHAGGGPCDGEYGWFSNSQLEWDSMTMHFSKTVVELCCDYPNGYCDLSATGELLDGFRRHDVGNIDKTAARNLLEKTLERLFNTHNGPPHGKYPLSDKIMYGSDWHMASIIGRSSEYLEAFLEIFSPQGGLNAYADRFFCKNAITYLQLKKHTQARRNQMSQDAIKSLENLISAMS